MIWRWLMGLFGRRNRHAAARSARLRLMESWEEAAVRRVVDQGVTATIEAAKASDMAERIIARNEGEAVVMTADLALRLLEREDKR